MIVQVAIALVVGSLARNPTLPPRFVVEPVVSVADFPIVAVSRAGVVVEVGDRLRFRTATSVVPTSVRVLLGGRQEYMLLSDNEDDGVDTGFSYVAVSPGDLKSLAAQLKAHGLTLNDFFVP